MVIEAGEFVALLATLTLPDTPPGAVGAKRTFSVAAWLGVSVVPAFTPLALNPSPDGVTPEMVTFEFPLLVKVTLNVVLVPSFTFPKVKLVWFASSRWVAATPVPLRLMLTGVLEALLRIEMFPDALPGEVGEKETVTVALLPGLRFRGTVTPLILNCAPVRVSCVTVSVSVPVFVTMMA